MAGSALSKVTRKDAVRKKPVTTLILANKSKKKTQIHYAKDIGCLKGRPITTRYGNGSIKELTVRGEKNWLKPKGNGIVAGSEKRLKKWPGYYN